MKGKAGNQNRFLRIITIPIRALGKARNFYVKTLTDYADRVSYGNIMGGPGTGQAPTLPRSFSVHTTRSFDNGDISELIRTSSARNSAVRDLDSFPKEQMQTKPPSSRSMGSRAMRRSSTVVMSRIEEDSPCNYFGENNVNKKVELLYPRSRSHVVSRKSVY